MKYIKLYEDFETEDFGFDVDMDMDNPVDMLNNHPQAEEIIKVLGDLFGTKENPMKSEKHKLIKSAYGTMAANSNYISYSKDGKPVVGWDDMGQKEDWLFIDWSVRNAMFPFFNTDPKNDLKYIFNLIKWYLNKVYNTPVLMVTTHFIEDWSSYMKEIEKSKVDTSPIQKIKSWFTPDTTNG